MTNKAKPPRWTTPKGVAAYAWLTKPDTEYVEDGVYHTKIRVDPNDDDVQEFLAKVKAAAAAHAKEAKLTAAQKKKYIWPFENEEDKDSGDETGFILIRAKTYATAKDGSPKTLPIFRPNGEALGADKPVYGGSVLQLAVSPAGYSHGKNVGLTLYLNAVMVHELVSGGSRTAAEYGFDITEDDGGSEPKTEEWDDTSAGDDGGDPDF